MAIATVHKIKDAAIHGVDTLKAAKGDSQYSVELRKQLIVAGALALTAGAIGFMALRSMKCAGEKAAAATDWKSKDVQLDKDLEDSLDASDAVAKY